MSEDEAIEAAAEAVRLSRREIDIGLLWIEDDDHPERALGFLDSSISMLVSAWYFVRSTVDVDTLPYEVADGPLALLQPGEHPADPS